MESDATVREGFTAADVTGVLAFTTNGSGNSKACVNRRTLNHQEDVGVGSAGHRHALSVA